MMVLGAVLLLMALPLPAALACSCIESTFEEAIEDRDLLARGVVTDVLTEDDGLVTYEVTLLTVWKGEEVPTIRLGTHEETTACGLGRLRVGETLQLWAYGAGGEYTMSWCGYPASGMEGNGRDQLTEALGDPWTNPDPPLISDEPGGAGDGEAIGGADRGLGGLAVLLIAAGVAVPLLAIGTLVVALVAVLIWYGRRTR